MAVSVSVILSLLGYLLQDGMLKQLGESYDPNYQYKRFNYRSNVDIDITKSTLLKVNIGGHVGAKENLGRMNCGEKYCGQLLSPAPG